MPSLWDAGAAEALVARVRRLTPESPGQWGRMSCPQMVVHDSDACRMYLDELPMRFTSSALQYSPLKQLIIYVLPFPKNVPTAPQLLVRKPGDWQADVDELCGEIVRLAGSRDRAAWPVHPIFRQLSPRAWGVLAWRHTDHHLRQFGV